jgi:hypothetical protein
MYHKGAFESLTGLRVNCVSKIVNAYLDSPSIRPALNSRACLDNLSQIRTIKDCAIFRSLINCMSIRDCAITCLTLILQNLLTVVTMYPVTSKRRTVFPPLDIELFRDEEPTEPSPLNTRSFEFIRKLENKFVRRK